MEAVPAENIEQSSSEELKSGILNFWFSVVPTFLVKILCFFIIPAFIIYSLLEIRFDHQTHLIKQKVIDKADEILELEAKYSTNQKYFHYLLKNIVDKAQETADPRAFIEINIKNLHANYPNSFEFIVWDQKGQVIKDLTDLKNKYALMRINYQALKQAAQTSSIYGETSENEELEQKMPFVMSKIHYVRKLLGRILVPSHLQKPYLHGTESGPFLTEIGGQFSKVWYRIGKKISLLCFFSDKIIKSNSTINNIIESINSKNPGFMCGYSLAKSYDTPKYPKLEVFKPFEKDLQLALIQFENSGVSLYETPRTIIKMGRPDSDIRTFCFYAKEESDWSKELRLNIIWRQTLIFILMIYAFTWFITKYKLQFVSISWKLVLLFLLANAIPLSIVGFLSLKLSDSTSQSMIKLQSEELTRRLRIFDEHYELLNENLKLMVTAKLDKINEEYKLKLKSSGISAMDPDMVTRLITYTEADFNNKNISTEFLKSFNNTEFALIDAYGNCPLYGIQPNEQKTASNMEPGNMPFITGMARSILAHCNKTRYDNPDSLIKSITSPENSFIVRDAYKLHSSIFTLKFYNSQKLYMYIFGDRENYNNTYLYLLRWNEEKFRTMYLDMFLKIFNQRNKQSKVSLYAYSINNSKLWLPQDNSFEGSKHLYSQMVTQSTRNEQKKVLLKINNEEYLSVISKGNKLTDTILAAVFPKKIIFDKINSQLNIILIYAAVSILFTTVLGMLLAKQFLTPIANLRQGTIAVTNQKYTHKIPILDDDEFGRLNQVFNRVISGLEDFETAKIIQESLLPGNHFQLKNMSIYAQNIVMTTLGGDYYDVVKIDDDHWGLVMGDVAGHGIGAGLMMAMAKAAVITASNEDKLNPAAVTTRLHKMFRAIKNEKLKRMMTCQYLTVTPVENKFSIANAGHCFPIIIHRDGREAEFIEHTSTPLGIGNRARYKNFEFILEPGEALILYTDGIAEAANERGEQYTFERLRRNISDLYDPDPEIYYKNIYGLYDDWSAEPDDDFTVMVINNVKA